MEGGRVILKIINSKSFYFYNFLVQIKLIDIRPCHTEIFLFRWKVVDNTQATCQVARRAGTTTFLELVRMCRTVILWQAMVSLVLYPLVVPKGVLVLARLLYLHPSIPG